MVSLFHQRRLLGLGRRRRPLFERESEHVVFPLLSDADDPSLCQPPEQQFLGERMPENVVLVMAQHGNKYVAGALNLLGKETIYGRNWGSYGDYKFLHFECCYYRAIEFAITRGLRRVEAGAQGSHKLQRGYLPTATYSAHWIPDPGFRRAVAQFLERERLMVERKIEGLAEYSPFRHVEE